LSTVQAIPQLHENYHGHENQGVVTMEGVEDFTDLHSTGQDKISESTPHFNAFPEFVEIDFRPDGSQFLSEFNNNMLDNDWYQFMGSSFASPNDMQMNNTVNSEKSHVIQPSLTEVLEPASPPCFEQRASTQASHSPPASTTTASPQTRYHCRISSCTSTFKRIHDLARHQKSHTGVRNYACSFRGCDRGGSNGFVRKDHWKQHLRQKHSF